jgi:hypothetical protein
LRISYLAGRSIFKEVARDMALFPVQVQRLLFEGLSHSREVIFDEDDWEHIWNAALLCARSSPNSPCESEGKILVRMGHFFKSKVSKAATGAIEGLVDNLRQSLGMIKLCVALPENSIWLILQKLINLGTFSDISIFKPFVRGLR